MDVILFSILTLFAVVLFILAFIRNHALLSMFAGISFIILGGFSFSGIEYVSSQTITTVGAVMTIVPIYTTWNHTFLNTNLTYSVALGLIFFLFGLFLLLVGSMIMFSGKSKADFSEDGDVE